MQLGNWLGLFLIAWNAMNAIRETATSLSHSLNSLSLKRKEDRDHGGALLIENAYRLFGNLCRKIPPTLSHVTMRYQEMREDDWRSWVHMCCDQSLSGSWESNFSCHLMEEESTEYSETRLEQSEPFKGTFLCSISFEIFIHLLRSICSREKDYDWRYSLVIIGWFFWVFKEKSFSLFSFYFLYL